VAVIQVVWPDKGIRLRLKKSGRLFVAHHGNYLSAVIRESPDGFLVITAIPGGPGPPIDVAPDLCRHLVANDPRCIAVCLSHARTQTAVKADAPLCQGPMAVPMASL